MAKPAAYDVKCWNCQAEYDAIAATWCNHASPTKICPFCLKCFCAASDDYKKQFVQQAPPELISEMVKSSGGRQRRMIGEILVDAGRISGEQLDEALYKQRILNRKLGEVLIMMSLLTPDELQLYLLNQKSFEEIDLASADIDASLMRRIGVEFCLEHHIVPIEIQEVKSGQVLRFAFYSPEALEKVKKSSEVGQYQLIPYMARAEDIESLLQRLTASEKEVKIYTSRDSLGHIETLNRIIRSAIDVGASDILFEFKENRLHTFLRIYENLTKVSTPEADAAAFFEKVKQVAGVRGAPKNVTFKSVVNLSREYRQLRIRTFYYAALEQENLRFQFIRLDRLDKRLADIGLGDDERNVLEQRLAQPNGLYLFCGPNYNHVPETLYTVIHSLSGDRVATVETHVLQKKEHCFQVEIDGQEVTDQVYANLLFFQPTVMALFDASQKHYHPRFFEFVRNGKLMLEVGGFSYEQVLEKLLGEYNMPFDFLARFLRLIVFQRVVRLLCPNCKRRNPTPSRQLLKHINLSREYEVFQETGCARCHFTGYDRSETVYEVYGPSGPFTQPDFVNLREHITSGGGLSISQKVLNRLLRGDVSFLEYSRFF